MSIYKFCLKCITSTSQFYWYIGIRIISGISSVAVPFVMGRIINLFTDNKLNIESLMTLCGVMIFMGAIKTIAEYFGTLQYAKLQANIAYKLNAETLFRVQKMPLSFFRQFDSAYYNQQINHDSNDLVIFIIDSTTNVIANGLTVLLIFVIILKIHFHLFILCVTLTVLYAILYWGFKKHLYSKGFSYQEKSAYFFSALFDQLDKVELIKKHTLFSKFAQKLERAFESVFCALYENQKIIANFTLSTSIISLLSQGILFIVGAYEIARGYLIPGYLISIVTYYSTLTTTAKYFLDWGKSYQDARVCQDRLDAIWSKPPENNGLERVRSINSLCCSNITFGYDNEKNEVLNDFSALFAAGYIYAITGQNGCGKSTVVKLLLGLYPTDYSGTIQYNGINLQDIDLYDLRAHSVGITEQEPTIIEDSIINNLTLLCDDPDMSLLDFYIDALGLRDFIKQLPDGLETKLTEQNQNLSGGEKQKIAIIRLLLKNPDVLIFDEPTSALDSASKTQFIDILMGIKHNHIIILITHDQSIADVCDYVIPL